MTVWDILFLTARSAEGDDALCQMAAAAREAGVEAVRADRLIADNLRVDGDWLLVGEEELDLRTIRRIAVVGAGKAGAGMAEAVENILGPKLRREKQLGGWVNVPADCARPLECIGAWHYGPACHAYGL